MVTVDDLLETIDKIDLGFETEEAFNTSAEDIINRQKDQLLHGLRADGSLIGKYASKVYAAKKFAQNPKAGFGNMDWKLTGSLHQDLFIDVREDIYIIDSADEKTGELIERFGDPFDLTVENKEKLVEEKLEETFIDRIKEATGL